MAANVWMSSHRANTAASATTHAPPDRHAHKAPAREVARLLSFNVATLASTPKRTKATVEHVTTPAPQARFATMEPASSPAPPPQPYAKAPAWIYKPISKTAAPAGQRARRFKLAFKGSAQTLAPEVK